MLVVYEVAVQFGLVWSVQKNTWFGSVRQIPGSVDHYSKPIRKKKAISKKNS
jgi:hypothetical protein